MKLFTFEKDNEDLFTMLFGPPREGVYHTGERVTIKERERHYVGEILYSIPPGKLLPSRKYTSRGHHTIAGTSYTNDVTARYLVDCDDGFPHVVYQSQVSREEAPASS